MPKVERTEVFKIEIEKMYQVITNYESYPEFVDGVAQVNVLKKTKTQAQVEYILNLIKKFKYVLDMKQKSPVSVSWNLIESDIFKKNTGSWKLEDLGEKGIKVTYALDVEFRGFVPKMIMDKLVSKNLPSMMKSYYNRAKEL